MMDLGGQTALVTGGAKRIGRAIVERLAAAGAGVVVHHHGSGREAKELVARLRRQGHAAWSVAADLRDDAEGLVAAAAKQAGQHVSLLVNNASTFPESRVADLTWEDLAASLRTDAWAPLLLTRQLAAQLPDGCDGAVVNLLDARIADDDRAHAGYWLAKRMLADLTRLCALEYAPRLRVNGVAPGPVLGPEGDPTYPKRMAKLLPLGRTPSPPDVAEAVAYLLGTPAVTAQLLFVDGGRHLGRQPNPPAGASAKAHQRRSR